MCGYFGFLNSSAVIHFCDFVKLVASLGLGGTSGRLRQKQESVLSLGRPAQGHLSHPSQGPLCQRACDLTLAGAERGRVSGRMQDTFSCFTGLPFFCKGEVDTLQRAGLRELETRDGTGGFNSVWTLSYTWASRADLFHIG